MRSMFGKLLRDYNCLLLCLALIIVSSIAIPGFLDPANLLNIIVETSFVGIIAIGMTFLLLIGLFDMSIGKQVSLCSLVVAITMRFGVVPSIVITLLAGIVMGLINGFVITKFKINAFIMTFAMMGILKGVNLLVCRGRSSIFIANDAFKAIYTQTVLGVPMCIVVFFVLAILTGLFLRYTRLGVNIYVTGGNLEAARLSGVNPTFVTIFSFVVISLCGAIAAILIASRVGVGSPILGDNYTLLVITACVIGGIKFSAGMGIYSIHFSECS